MFKYFDLLKIVLSLFVVSIHLNNHINNIYWTRISSMAVPLFFSLSAILFWNRLTKNDDVYILKHYCFRLFTLIGSWSLLLSPLWLQAFIHQYPDTWIYYLIPKLLLYGGCRGGYFIMSLIYGTIILYYLHKVLNKYIVLSICLIYGLYYQLVVWYIIPDYLHVRFHYYFFDTDFLPFRFLFYIDVAAYLIPYISNKLKKIKQFQFHASAFLFILTICINSSSISLMVGIIFQIVFLASLSNIKCNNLPNYLIIFRKMSIVIFFIHFVVIDYIEEILFSLFEINNISNIEFRTFYEFMFVLALVLPLSFFIVSFLSKRITFFKNLY